MQRRCHRRACFVGQGLLAAQQPALQGHRVFDAALDAAHLRETAVVGDIRSLAGPRRYCAETRHHEEGFGRATFFDVLEWIAVMHQRFDLRAVFRGQRRLRVDEMQILAAHTGNVGVDAGERVEQTGLTEIGRAEAPGKHRSGPWT